MAVQRPEQPGLNYPRQLRGMPPWAKAMARFVIYPGTQSVTVLFFPFIILIRGGLSR
jgi:hypothetical protein